MTKRAEGSARVLERQARTLLAQLEPDGTALPVCEPETLRYCLTRDWARRAGEVVALTEAGRSFLRRQTNADDPFQAQHQMRETRASSDGGAKVTVNHAESPLGWLRRRKDRSGHPLIGAEQFAAGERLRADHWRAHLSPKVTSNWSPTAGAPSRRSRRGGTHDPASLSDDAIAAKQRVWRALDAVGPELAGILLDVCCDLKGLEDAELTFGWPKRSGKIVLDLALTRLARHYGLLRPEGESRRTRHWGAADYRPKI